MKIEPLVFNHLKTNHTSFEVDFKLDNNLTFIIGDSGTGKSMVYSFLQELSAEDNRIKCFNYLDQKKQYKNSIKKFHGKLIVIDNADLLLDDNMRWYIATDCKNQYIIIGRNPTGLMLQQDEIVELCSETVEGKTKLWLA